MDNKNILKINTTFPLYVGAGKNYHLCPSKNPKIQIIRAKFIKNLVEFEQDITYCKSCNAFIIVKNDMANLKKFKEYKLFSGITGNEIKILEPIKRTLPKSKKLSKHKKKRPIKKYQLKHEQWYISHPWQGGGCSGK